MKEGNKKGPRALPNARDGYFFLGWGDAALERFFFIGVGGRLRWVYVGSVRVLERSSTTQR
jgi:hypothetical protein